MFVTRKRIALPPVLILNTDTKIMVVNEFKLLGIWLDSKLSFSLHVAKTCLQINRKLYSIKNIFYLSSEVKLQFFKTFILPYFDYAISLSLYFPREAVKKLAKLYYICLFKLLRVNVIGYSLMQINAALKPLNLFSFHHRCLYRILFFIFKLKSDRNSPERLRKGLEYVSSFSHTYNLRKTTLRKIKLAGTRTNIGDNIFRNAFGKLLNKLDFDEHEFSKDSLPLFKKKILSRFNDYMDIFTRICTNFNFTEFSYIFYK